MPVLEVERSRSHARFHDVQNERATRNAFKFASAERTKAMQEQMQLPISSLATAQVMISPQSTKLGFHLPAASPSSTSLGVTTSIGL